MAIITRERENLQLFTSTEANVLIDNFRETRDSALYFIESPLGEALTLVKLENKERNSARDVFIRFRQINSHKVFEEKKSDYDLTWILYDASHITVGESLWDLEENQTGFLISCPWDKENTKRFRATILKVFDNRIWVQKESMDNKGSYSFRNWQTTWAFEEETLTEISQNEGKEKERTTEMNIVTKSGKSTKNSAFEESCAFFHILPMHMGYDVNTNCDDDMAFFATMQDLMFYIRENIILGKGAKAVGKLFQAMQEELHDADLVCLVEKVKDLVNKEKEVDALAQKMRDSFSSDSELIEYLLEESPSLCEKLIKRKEEKND